PRRLPRGVRPPAAAAWRFGRSGTRGGRSCRRGRASLRVATTPAAGFAHVADDVTPSDPHRSAAGEEPPARRGHLGLPVLELPDQGVRRADAQPFPDLARDSRLVLARDAG